MEENIFKSEETQIENEIQLRVKAELEKLAKDPYAIIKAYQEIVKQNVELLLKHVNKEHGQKN